jgi:SAM-dependent methyltransferase
MPVVSKLSNVLAHPTAYRLWQAPFVESKFEPIRRHNDLRAVRRVLDVGCGPGTNASLFYGLDYLGLDLSPEYIAQARRRHPLNFEVADVCTWQADPDRRFDFILLNSLLHHIATDDVHRILDQLTRQATPDGHIHIIDLVLPSNRCLARTLALADRGHFARPLDEWRQIFTAHFREVVFEPFDLAMTGLKLWNLVYFKGAARS